MKPNENPVVAAIKNSWTEALLIRSYQIIKWVVGKVRWGGNGSFVGGGNDIGGIGCLGEGVSRTCKQNNLNKDTRIKISHGFHGLRL